MRDSRVLNFSAVITIALVISIMMTETKAAVVWSDDFNDGNYDGWTVQVGGFSASNFYLECTEDTWPDSFSQIHHPSTVSAGSWSFDCYLPTEHAGMIIATFWTDEQGLAHGSNFRVEIDRVRIDLCRYTEGGMEVLELDTWAADSSFADTWTHIDVTMDESFVIDLFVNGTHAIHYTTLSPGTTCTHMNFAMNNIGHAVDNIVVSDTIDVECTNDTCDVCPDETTPVETTPTDTATTTPPPDGPATLPIEILALGVGAAVVLVVIVVLLKRR
jgi:hypothetical protein